MNQEQQQYVEEMGLYLEGLGSTRMIGRIIGYLMICHPAEQTMPDITEALKASKSSVSTALKMLTQLYLVERISILGERRDYFRLIDDIWMRSFESREHELRQLRELAERGLALLGDAPPEATDRLRKAYDMAVYLEREFPKIVEGWREERAKLGYDDD